MKQVVFDLLHGFKFVSSWTILITSFISFHFLLNVPIGYECFGIAMVIFLIIMNGFAMRRKINLKDDR